MRERIAIHSSKKPDPNRNALAALLEDAATRIECMQSPNGAILGTVELVECIDKNEDHTFVGPYGRGWPVRVPCANRFRARQYRVMAISRVDRLLLTDDAQTTRRADERSGSTAYFRAKFERLPRPNVSKCSVFERLPAAWLDAHLMVIDLDQ